jgi:hypothetical protein
MDHRVKPGGDEKRKRRDSRQRDFALDLKKHAPELAA